MKGRKPTPTEIKKMKGTDQPSRLNKNEPSAQVVSKLPPAPSWFSDMAKKIYRSKGKELINQKILSPVDLDMFATYCHEYAVYIETSKVISEVPFDSQLTEASTEVYKRIRQQNQQAFDRAKSIATEFGFTPSSRSKVNAIDAGQQLSDFEKMMKGL